MRPSWERSAEHGQSGGRARIKLVVGRVRMLATEPAEELVTFMIFNRGRRPIHVLTIERVASAREGITEVLHLASRRAGEATTFEEGRSRSYEIGAAEGYEPGSILSLAGTSLTRLGASTP
jgi:hypothetical protein